MPKICYVAKRFRQEPLAAIEQSNAIERSVLEWISGRSDELIVRGVEVQDWLSD